LGIYPTRDAVRPCNTYARPVGTSHCRAIVTSTAIVGVQISNLRPKARDGDQRMRVAHGANSADSFRWSLRKPPGRTERCRRPCSNLLRSSAIRTRKVIDKKKTTPGRERIWIFGSPRTRSYNFLSAAFELLGRESGLACLARDDVSVYAQTYR
jgi:hypothetical protein